MIEQDYSVLYKISIVLFLSCHILFSSFNLKRYLFDFDELSFIQKAYLISLLIFFPFACFLLFFNGISSVFAYTIFFLLLRFIHITRRYKSLSRGAGAVGIVPLQVIFFSLLFEISLIYHGLSSLLVIHLFMISQGLMMLEAGIYKALFGYNDSTSLGLTPALLNPCWSRLYFLFNKCDQYIFRFINKSAIVLQITCGCLLLSQIHTLQVIGFALYFLIFGFMFLVIDLGSLSFLSVLLPIYSIIILFHYPSALPGSVLDNNNSFLLIAIACYLLYFFTKKLGLYAVLLESKGFLSLDHIINKNLSLGPLNTKFASTIFRSFKSFDKCLSNRIPIFPWRVFTPDITDTYLSIRYHTNLSNSNQTVVHNIDWKTRPVFLKVLPGFSCRHRKSLWAVLSYASESIVQTTIANGFKYNPNRSFRHACRYICSLLQLMPANISKIELVVFQFSPQIYSWRPRVKVSCALDTYSCKYLQKDIDSSAVLAFIEPFEHKSIAYDSQYFKDLSNSSPSK